MAKEFLPLGLLSKSPTKEIPKARVLFLDQEPSGSFYKNFERPSKSILVRSKKSSRRPTNVHNEPKTLRWAERIDTEYTVPNWDRRSKYAEPVPVVSQLKRYFKKSRIATVALFVFIVVFVLSISGFIGYLIYQRLGR
jgi:hypothetical protein